MADKKHVYLKKLEKYVSNKAYHTEIVCDKRKK